MKLYWWRQTNAHFRLRLRQAGDREVVGRVPIRVFRYGVCLVCSRTRVSYLNRLHTLTPADLSAYARSIHASLHLYCSNLG